MIIHDGNIVLERGTCVFDFLECYIELVFRKIFLSS